MEAEEEFMTGAYDFGARIYNSKIGRWMATDPLEMKYPYLSPYNFVANTPTLYVDKDGKDFKVIINHKDKSITIVATYAAVDEKGKKALKEANKIWRNTKYTDGKTGYSVHFDLTVESKLFEASQEDIQKRMDKFNKGREESEKMTFEGLSEKNQKVVIDKIITKKFLEYKKDHPEVNLYKDLTSSSQSDKMEYPFPPGTELMTHYAPFINSNFVVIDGKKMSIGSEFDYTFRSLAHEIGHSLGLSDRGGKFFPGNIMAYYKSFSERPLPNDRVVQKILSYVKFAKEYGKKSIINGKTYHYFVIKKPGKLDADGPKFTIEEKNLGDKVGNSPIDTKKKK